MVSGTAYLLEELNQRCAERLGKKLTAAEERRLVELLNAAASPEFRREPGVPAQALSRVFRRNAS